MHPAKFEELPGIARNLPKEIGRGSFHLIPFDKNALHNICRKNGLANENVPTAGLSDLAKVA